MNDKVECHSEFAYAEKPVALTWNGIRLEIQAILSQWRSPEGKHFRVITEDGQVFDLLYDDLSDEWQIHQP